MNAEESVNPPAAGERVSAAHKEDIDAYNREVDVCNREVELYNAGKGIAGRSRRKADKQNG